MKKFFIIFSCIVFSGFAIQEEVDEACTYEELIAIDEEFSDQYSQIEDPRNDEIFKSVFDNYLSNEQEVLFGLIVASIDAFHSRTMTLSCSSYRDLSEKILALDFRLIESMEEIIIAYAVDDSERIENAMNEFNEVIEEMLNTYNS